MDDGAIEHLPPLLTSLHVFSEAEMGLTDACVPHFPRRLTAIHLPKCPRITLTPMKHFPRSLTELSLGAHFRKLFPFSLTPYLSPLLKHSTIFSRTRIHTEVEEDLVKKILDASDSE